MVLFALFALGLLTVAELWVILQIDHAIGALPTIGLMVLDAAIGSAIMRAQGRVAWRRFREALAAGRIPAREALDGTLVVVGGAFLITPGFITDVIGLVLLVPAGRGLVRRALVRRLAGRLTGGVYGRPRGGPGSPGTPGSPGAAESPGDPARPGLRPPQRPTDVEGSGRESGPAAPRQP